jgi:hypothetical protein
MEKIKFNVLIFLVYLAQTIHCQDVMSEYNLRGLLDTMTIHQLEVINQEINTYIHEKFIRFLSSEVGDGDGIRIAHQKKTYIDLIVEKVRKNPELFNIDNFGLILERIGDILENDEGDGELAAH